MVCGCVCAVEHGLYRSGAAPGHDQKTIVSDQKMIISGGISYVAFGIKFTSRQIVFFPRQMGFLVFCSRNFFPQKNSLGV